MPLFISLSLILSFIVQTENSLRSVLASPLVIDIGITGSIVAIAAMILKKWSELIWYDLFSSCTLLTWFAYWQPIFKEESPMFFFFPLFFAGMTTFVSLAFINQRDKIDAVTLGMMRRISEQAGLQPWVIMICVLGSLKLQEHYLVYPVMTVLLLLRFTLSRCIEKK